LKITKIYCIYKLPVRVNPGESRGSQSHRPKVAQQAVAFLGKLGSWRCYGSWVASENLPYRPFLFPTNKNPTPYLKAKIEAILTDLEVSVMPIW
jgi:hypothetical protein